MHVLKKLRCSVIESAGNSLLRAFSLLREGKLRVSDPFNNKIDLYARGLTLTMRSRLIGSRIFRNVTEIIIKNVVLIMSALEICS